MFEELYALAILYAGGFDTGKQYQNLMNKMTLEGREDILELQYLPMRDAVVRTMFMAENGTPFDMEVFGRYLMRHLQETCEGKSLNFIGKRLYTLRKGLPGYLQYEYPFEFLIYADDEAALCSEGHISEKQGRIWFEDVFNYYDNGGIIRPGITVLSQLCYAREHPELYS